jgi:hypothetical protein
VVVREILDFYRRNPVVLVLAVVVAGVLIAGALADGDGVGIGEILAVLGAGAVFGMLMAYFRRRGR